MARRECHQGASPLRGDRLVSSYLLTVFTLYACLSLLEALKVL